MDEIVSRIMDSEQWPNLSLPENLELLNEMADQCFAERSFSSMLAATMMYQQIIEAMCCHLIDDCHFQIQLSLYPTTISFKNYSSKMLGFYLDELRSSIDFYKKASFVEKVENFNAFRNRIVHEMRKSNIDDLAQKDFVYDDAFVDITDGFNHSKWLSFMKQRLMLSKKLLTPHGTIFMSIDDNEFSQLKLLCDEVFGANNYVGTILWKKKTNGNNMGWLPPVHDYILCYSKEIEKIYDLGFEVSEEDILKNYSNPDNDPRGPWTTTDLSANHKGPYFPVTNPKTGKVYYPPDGRYWVFNEQEIQRRIADGRIIFGKSGTARPVQRVFAKDRKFSKRKAESWWDNHGMNADATQELKDIFGVAKVFTHPKPTQLIKDIVAMSCSKTATILDFFAGSGTTGHAVMKLNAEDGGNRKFILCTNNENNICRDVTYERIKRVIDKEGYAASLKYYKVEYVPISERLYYEYADELLCHIRELVELENGINFTNNTEIAISLTDEELEAFTRDTDKLAKCRKLYMGHDLLPDENQEKALKENGVEISIIPDYYYHDLQEG